jgi:hypothetical protein
VISKGRILGCTPAWILALRSSPARECLPWAAYLLAWTCGWLPGLGACCSKQATGCRGELGAASVQQGLIGATLLLSCPWCWAERMMCAVLVPADQLRAFAVLQTSA